MSKRGVLLSKVAAGVLGLGLVACGGHFEPDRSGTTTSTSSTPTEPPSSALRSAAELEAAEARTLWMPVFTAHPRHNEVGACEPGIEVELSVTGQALGAALVSDKIESCGKSPVEANKRFYELRLIGQDCGSRIYAGVLSGMQGTSQIRIIDHSRRSCDDLRRAMIEIEERGPGQTQRLYAGDWQT